MKIVIIEDEEIVADELEQNIRRVLEEPVKIVKIMSVAEGTSYFKNNEAPDLIFSDIQLGDGLSFEIFINHSMSVPVIFCTAYDEYALDAFKANGIDYILKPFTYDTLSKALGKFMRLTKKSAGNQTPQLEALMQMLNNTKGQTASSILVYHQEKIIPINLKDIAIFYLDNEISHLITFSGKVFYPNKNLDELERLAGDSFFRANRQFLVCRRSIQDVSNFFSRKLVVNLNISFEHQVIVSKMKAPHFLKWLANS